MTIILANLTTEHPDGWADILQALENHAGETRIDSGDVLARIKKSTATAVVSGLMANGAQAELARAGLPLPGDPHWLVPADGWFTRLATHVEGHPKGES